MLTWTNSRSDWGTLRARPHFLLAGACNSLSLRPVKERERERVRERKRERKKERERKRDKERERKRERE